MLGCWLPLEVDGGLLVGVERIARRGVFRELCLLCGLRHRWRLLRSRLLAADMVLVDRVDPVCTGHLDRYGTLRRFERCLRQIWCWVRMKGHLNGYVLISGYEQSRNARELVA